MSALRSRINVAAAALLGVATCATVVVFAGAPASASSGYSSTTLVSDSFNRSVHNGFGTASVGGRYQRVDDTVKTSRARAGRPSVSKGRGRFVGVRPGHSVEEVLGSRRTRDASGRLRFVLPAVRGKRFDQSTGFTLRRTGNARYYSALVRVTSRGRATLTVTNSWRGGHATLVAPKYIGYVHAHQTVIIEMSATGAGAVRVAARAWLSGHHAPAWRVATSRAHAINGSGGTSVLAATGRGTRATETQLHDFTVAALHRIPIPPQPARISHHRPVHKPVAPKPVPTPPTTTPPTTTPPTTTPPTTTPPTTTPPTTTPPTTTPPTTTPPTTTPPTTTPPTTTPPTTTPAQPGSPSSGSAPAATAGSTPVGEAAYAPPADAIYVASTGSDSAAGTVSAPLQTVKAALSRAKSGGTVVVRGGTYNQSTFVANSNVTIQAYPHEAVWFDGSVPVTGWSQVGSTWVHSGWTSKFDSSATFTPGQPDTGGFLNASYPMASHPDQVFADGTQLRQVRSNPGAGQFAVDYSAQTITVGSDPSGHDLRASNLSKAFVIAGGYVTLRGFGVQNYATALPDMGTVYQGGSVGHGVFENLVIRNNATTGLNLTQPGNLVSHVTSELNGMSGMQVGTMLRGRDGEGERVEYSDISRNDREGFVNGPATGAIKIGGISGISVVHNTVQDNLSSTGIWTDQSVTHFVIAGNTVTGNGPTYGILNELSNYGVVADNRIDGSRYGYTAFDSGNIQIFNNVITNRSAVWQIGLSQDARYQQKVANGPTPSCPWLVENITVSNNELGPASMFQFYAMDKETTRSADSMGITLNGNQFDFELGDTDTMVGWGTSNRTVVSYKLLAVFALAMNKPWLNTQRPAALLNTSPSFAVSLPSAVMSALGLTSSAGRVGLL